MLFNHTSAQFRPFSVLCVCVCVGGCIYIYIYIYICVCVCTYVCVQQSDIRRSSSRPGAKGGHVTMYLLIDCLSCQDVIVSMVLLYVCSRIFNISVYILSCISNNVYYWHGFSTYKVIGLTSLYIVSRKIYCNVYIYIYIYIYILCTVYGE